MSENKHTPEPWCISDHNKSIIKCYQGEQTPHGTTPYFAGGGALESERTANARRVVACVNACAGCATEVLETAPVGFLNSTYGHPKYLEEITKQRDELLAALERFATWARGQHKAQSKGCHATFDMMMLRDEIDFAEAAITRVKGEQ